MKEIYQRKEYLQTAHFFQLYIWAMGLPFHEFLFVKATDQCMGIKMSEPVILLESQSPSCNIQAFVEESDTCCYFYLWFHAGWEKAFIKSCWICNVTKAPESIDKKAMEEGMAPAMPKQYINHDINGIHLNKEELSIVWFEEGDAAALLEGDRLLSVIPGWGGYNNFYGYSRYAVGTAPYAWELTQAYEVLQDRVEKSRKFWDYIDGEYWEGIQQIHMQTLEAFFGNYEKYFAIDGGNFPPKALVIGKKDNICYGITMGVSLLPMPLIEQYYHDKPSDFRRIEIGFASLEEHQDVCMKMYSFISGISSLPWREISFLGHGHTIPCSVIDGFCAVWLLDSRLLQQINAPIYEDFMGDKINLLWVVPLKENEYKKIKDYETEEALKNLAAEIEKIHIFDGTGKMEGR